MAEAQLKNYQWKDLWRMAGKRNGKGRGMGKGWMVERDENGNKRKRSRRERRGKRV